MTEQRRDLLTRSPGPAVSSPASTSDAAEAALLRAFQEALSGPLRGYHRDCVEEVPVEPYSSVADFHEAMYGTFSPLGIIGSDSREKR